MLRTIGRWWRDFDDRRLSGRGLLLYVLIVVSAWVGLTARWYAVVMGELLPAREVAEYADLACLAALVSAEAVRAFRLSRNPSAAKGAGAATLLERLRWAATGALYALTDAVERYWRDPHPTDEALVRAGLVPTPEGEHD